MDPHVADRFFLLTALLAPIPLIVFWRLKGAFVGALIPWVVGVVAGEVLSDLDPDRDAAILDSVWFLFGWAGGLLYCMPIYAVGEFVRDAIYNKRQAAAQPAERMSDCETPKGE